MKACCKARRISWRIPWRTRGANRPNANSTSGATLVEVMFAMLILAILVAVLPKVVEHPRRMAVNAAWRQMSLEAANEVLEEAASVGYAKLDTLDVNAIAGNFALNGRPLSGTIAITLQGSGSLDDPYFKEVAVTISPIDGGDSVTLETLVFEE